MQAVQSTKFDTAETVKHIDLMWHSRHLKLDADLKSLLNPRLEKYQMSPTHLNTFIDMEYGGPEIFLLQTLLRFPQAPGEDGEFGNAIHGTLEWYQTQLSKSSSVPISKVLKEFNRQLEHRYIPKSRIDDFRNRGQHALKTYIPASSEMFARNAKAEVDFRKEGVVLNDKAHLSGKIDRLEIDKKAKTVNIVDFKTGKPHTKWGRSVKLLKYKQQLCFYKFLIEGSHTWQNYKVAEARLEFVEPDAEGNPVPPLLIEFNETEEKDMEKLIISVWDKIKSLELPDTTEYSDDFKGANALINDLLDK